MRRSMKLLAAATLLSALAFPASALAGDDLGRQLVQTNCGRCHAIAHDDRSPLPLAPPFREVAKRYPPESLSESLAEGIVTGHDGMPEFVFEPQQIVAIVNYLKSLAKP